MCREIHPFLIVIIDVARGGLEPPRTVPKTAVLPLDDRAILVFLTDTKIRNIIGISQPPTAFLNIKQPSQDLFLQKCLY